MYQKFKCTTCSKTVEMNVPSTGLGIINNCVVTNNCKGTMYLDKDKFSNKDSETYRLDKKQILFEHYQKYKNNKWMVYHNLNGIPRLHVWIDILTDGVYSSKQVIPKEIINISPNVTQIVFDYPQSGRVQCVMVDTPERIEKYESNDVNYIQITQDSELTFLTKSAAVNLTINMEYSNEVNRYTSEYYAKDFISSNSPWFGVDIIKFDGKAYTARSLNLKTTPRGNLLFSENLIKDLMNVSITGIDYMLLTNKPFSTDDKVLNKILIPNNNIFFEKNELWIVENSSSIVSIFPNMKL